MNGKFKRAHGLHLSPIPTFIWKDCGKPKKKIQHSKALGHIQHPGTTQI